jgi:murein DD-endopeptidase MepM/ murein hydrolase activator NlpD
VKNTILGALALLLVATQAHAGQFIYAQGGVVTTVWGTQRSYEVHRALDIAAPAGTNNVAARQGRVKIAATGGYNGGLGHYVVISHDSGYETWYLHNNTVYVRSGQSVRAGQAIGSEGTTGFSTGPHLHFEVRHYGAKIFIPGRGSVRRGATIPQNYPGLGGTKGGIAPGGNGGGAGSSSGNGLLAVGSQGKSVSHLQRLLTKKGFEPGPIDGIFGPKTRAAVVSFQRRKGLTADGIVGPITKKALGW